MDIQTLKVYDGQDLDHIEPVSSNEEDELIGQQSVNRQQLGQGHPNSNTEYLTISSDTEDSDQEVRFVNRGKLEHKKLFDLNSTSEEECSNHDQYSGSEVIDVLNIGCETSSSEGEEQALISQVPIVPRAKSKSIYQQSQMAPNKVANRHSWPMSAYDPPQYCKQPMSTLVSYELPSSSKINDGEFQSRCLQKLKQHLMMKSKLGHEIRSDIEQKIMKTLGMGAIPNPGSISIFPFIHFEGSGE